MIRGPVLPQMRDSLWALVSKRLDRIETGLELVLESLDCSDGELGLVDGLARDALGGPVLVLLAVDGDALLSARVLAAGAFLKRVGDALAGAVPEAGFRPGVAGRLVVIGTDASAALLEQVVVLPVDGLQACVLEPFRLAGSERFAIRWVPEGRLEDGRRGRPPVAASAGATPPPAAGAVEFVVPADRADLWSSLSEICARIDPGVCVHGDRYSRRVTWNGRPLGDVRIVDGGLVASAATGVVRELRDANDVRRFGDQLLRAYARHARLDLGPAEDRRAQPQRRAGDRDGAERGHAATRHAAGEFQGGEGRGGEGRVESLRSSLAASRLSPEEYSALGEPASLAGASPEGSVARDRSQASPDPGASSAGRTD